MKVPGQWPLAAFSVLFAAPRLTYTCIRNTHTQNRHVELNNRTTLFVGRGEAFVSRRAGAPPLPSERPLAVVALLVEVARRAHRLVDYGSRLQGVVFHKGGVKRGRGGGGGGGAENRASRGAGDKAGAGLRTKHEQRY